MIHTVDQRRETLARFGLERGGAHIRGLARAELRELGVQVATGKADLARAKRRRVKRDAKRLASTERSELRERAVARDQGCAVVAKHLFGLCAGGLHMDHQWGRGKVPEALENVRMLCARHDRMKTENEPGRVAWLVDWKQHCLRHGYASEVEKADAAIALELGQHPKAAAQGE